ncbi:hypothetical protein [Franzmannia qiaohouensis]|uniref:Uncharacterized protein n=1 Tax=Franzmannia qiaohouensis TaxID=1329370 RepID=A0ABU1HE51_9GAMM|nr:hypothetical protein [Halomonas qiaohouensis]MDR5905119.1 hypothetical protein [Halomonas qiaohouensis]
MSATVPDWLRGVWQRVRIDHADGRRDTSTRVFWFQGLSHYGDLRIAASRPQVSQLGASPSADLALAHQQGATGRCHCPDHQATWQREWGYQPVVDFPEPGDLEAHGSVVIERAPSGAYEEEWHRLTPPAPSIQVWRRDDSRARLLVIDGYAMLIARRPVEPPPRPLATLLTEGTATAHQLLDCEISCAVRAAPGEAFVIQLSTLPWREQHPLALCNGRGEITAPGWQLEEHHPGSPATDYSDSASATGPRPASTSANAKMVRALQVKR